MPLARTLAVKAALIQTLGSAAVQRWQTVGYGAQSVDASRALNNLRRVAVAYSGGPFPEGRSPRVPGPFRHEPTFKVNLLVSADAHADLSVLDDPDALPAARVAALAASLDASARADTVFDDLVSLVWDVLMLPANLTLGMAVGSMADRWVGNIRKGEPEERGSIVVIGGSLDYSCAVYEVATGVAAVQGESVDLSVSVTGDISGAAFDPALQGVEAQQP